MAKADQQNKKNSVELEASLAPAEAEVGALAKADQIFVKVALKKLAHLWVT